MKKPTDRQAKASMTSDTRLARPAATAARIATTRAQAAIELTTKRWNTTFWKSRSRPGMVRRPTKSAAGVPTSRRRTSVCPWSGKWRVRATWPRPNAMP
jgi:hypothetical protein